MRAFIKIMYLLTIFCGMCLVYCGFRLILSWGEPVIGVIVLAGMICMCYVMLLPHIEREIDDLENEGEQL